MSDKTDANDAKEQAFDKFFFQVDYWAKVHENILKIGPGHIVKVKHEDEEKKQKK